MNLRLTVATSESKRKQKDIEMFVVGNILSGIFFQYRVSCKHVKTNKKMFQFFSDLMMPLSLYIPLSVLPHN